MNIEQIDEIKERVAQMTKRLSGEFGNYIGISDKNQILMLLDDIEDLIDEVLYYT